MKICIFWIFLIFFKIYTKNEGHIRFQHWALRWKKKKELECNINKRHEEINKNYLMDTEKAFMLEKRIELQHITFLSKKKSKNKS